MSTINYDPSADQVNTAVNKANATYCFAYEHEENQVYNLATEDNIDDITISKSKTFLNKIPGLGKLKKPLAVELNVENNTYIVYCDDLEIVESGENAEMALNNFFGFLKEDYQNWLDASDDELSKKALSLKQRYKNYIE